MSHDCRIGEIQVVEDACGVLYINIRTGLTNRSKDCRVDFCPVCGHPSAIKIGEKLAIFSRNDVRNDLKDGSDKPIVPDIPSSRNCFFPLAESCGPPVDPISDFFSQWASRVEELNKNIDAVKAFMISQNCLNESFTHQQAEINHRLAKLERKNG